MSDENNKEINKEQTNTLLNCPFCGGGLELTKDKKFYEHPCSNCFLSLAHIKNTERRIKAWNTRIPMQNIVERLEDFREEAFREVELDFATAYANAIRIVVEEGGLHENR